MKKEDRGQLSGRAAEVYEEFFLPALFEPWSPQVADAAGITGGQRVLDVACGTGVLAREAATRVRPHGAVVGFDLNEGMLAVARSRAPGIEWRQGRAEDLPFDTDSFDAVISQFGLMFFEDRAAAAREMVRVLKPGGRLAVAVWDALERVPGYLAVTNLLERLFGAEVAAALRAPYSLGNPRDLSSLFEHLGLRELRIETRPGTAVFSSIESWMFTDVKGWTLGDRIDDEQYTRLVTEAEGTLQGFTDTTGKVVFDHPAHILSAVKP